MEGAEEGGGADSVVGAGEEVVVDVDVEVEVDPPPPLPSCIHQPPFSLIQ